jgi:hypothetical protein
MLPINENRAMGTFSAKKKVMKNDEKIEKINPAFLLRSAVTSIVPIANGIA